MDKEIQIDVELDSDNFEGVIKGVAIPYNTPVYRSGGYYIEFSKQALENNVGKTVRVIPNHDDKVTNILGSANFISVSNRGLEFEATMFQKAIKDNNVEEPLKNGLITGVSAGIKLLKYEKKAYKGKVMYKALEAPIHELTLTNTPAFKQAIITEVLESNSTDTTLGLNYEELTKGIEMKELNFKLELGGMNNDR